MAFKPGNKLAGSRKGIPNKATQAARAIAEAAGFCPITALIDGYKVAQARFIEEIEKQDSGSLSPMESAAPKYLKMALDAASDIAGYVHPKLKSVEQTKPDPLKDMTIHEKLQAMKQAVRLLEAEAGTVNESGAV